MATVLERALVNTATTEQRFRARQPVRNAANVAFQTGQWNRVDTPARLQQRLDRLDVPAPIAQELLAGNAPSAQAVAQLSPGDQLGLERVIGDNDMVGSAFLELGVLRVKPVCRIRVNDAAGNPLGMGTGCLVGPGLLLTNHHVLESADEAAKSLAEFNFQLDVNGQHVQVNVFRIRPDVFFRTDVQFDFTVVAVDPKATNGTELASFGYVQLIESTGKVVNKEAINIIQHPEGQEKQYALRENRLVDVLDDFLHYETDTAPGSSGSPLFSDQWELVGLHHSGVPKKDAAGNILTRDGRIWASSMGESAID
jgi:endonuclease G